MRLDEIIASASDKAVSIAAKFLETDPDNLTTVIDQEIIDDVLDHGKQLDKEFIKTADSQWVVVLYKNKNQRFVRVESPRMKHKLLTVTPKSEGVNHEIFR